MQDRWDAGQVRCRTRGMQEGEEFSRCRMRNKMDAGEDTVDTVEEIGIQNRRMQARRSIKGGNQERKDAGKMQEMRTQ